MYIDRNQLKEFPFYGTFYKMGIDESLPLIEQKEEEIIVATTKCDIQETSKSLNGTITANWAIYFPFDNEVELPIKRGILFKGSMYGLEINGVVRAIVPTQMGKCVAYIVDKDV